jgi:hypothetical protein
MSKRLAVLGFLTFGIFAGAEKPLLVPVSHQQEQTKIHSDTGQPAAEAPCTSDARRHGHQH